jgi:hypothetical protein
MATRVSSPAYSNLSEGSVGSEGGVPLRLSRQIPSPSTQLDLSNGSAAREGRMLLRLRKGLEYKQTPLIVVDNHTNQPRNQQISLRSLDWCDRGIHVDFDPDEIVPLQRGRLLGHGIQGNCRFELIQLRISGLMTMISQAACMKPYAKELRWHGKRSTVAGE